MEPGRGVGLIETWHVLADFRRDPGMQTSGDCQASNFEEPGHFTG